MRLLTCVIIGGLSFLVVAHAQSAANPSFEAASIKTNSSGRNGRLTMTTGRINFSSVTLKECVIAAYDLRGYQVAGPASLTAFLTSDRYDIVATADGPASNAELKAMLKTLLADRFKMKTHVETREMAAYRLVVTKTAPKITHAATGQPGSYALDGGAVVFHGTSMQAFADYLSHRGPIDRPVLDGTGLGGLFDFKLNLFDVRPDMPLDALKRAYFEWDQGSSIFTDIQEQLGMKLQAEKSPIEVLVVDSVSKPSEN